MAKSSARKNLIQELERGHGNLEWLQTHLTRSLEMYINSIDMLTAENQSIPEEYLEHMQFITAMLEGVDMMKTSLFSFTQSL